MAKSFLANTIPHLHTFSFPKNATVNLYTHRFLTAKCCKTTPKPQVLTKRSLTANLLATSTLSLAGKGFFDADAAILEADANVDRKERTELQASTTETAYLQELVNKLGKVGQAIRDDKLSVASSALGPSSNSDWIKKANAAFTKLSSSPEEMAEVDTLNSSLTSLIASVARRDMKSTKAAFVTSVVALEKWTSLTGLGGQLQGL